MLNKDENKLPTIQEPELNYHIKKKLLYKNQIIALKMNNKQLANLQSNSTFRGNLNLRNHHLISSFFEKSIHLATSRKIQSENYNLEKKEIFENEILKSINIVSNKKLYKKNILNDKVNLINQKSKLKYTKNKSIPKFISNKLIPKISLVLLPKPIISFSKNKKGEKNEKNDKSDDTISLNNSLNDSHSILVNGVSQMYNKTEYFENLPVSKITDYNTAGGYTFYSGSNNSSNFNSRKKFSSNLFFSHPIKEKSNLIFNEYKNNKFDSGKNTEILSSAHNLLEEYKSKSSNFKKVGEKSQEKSNKNKVKEVNKREKLLKFKKEMKDDKFKVLKLEILKNNLKLKEIIGEVSKAQKNSELMQKNFCKIEYIEKKLIKAKYDDE